MKKFLVIVTFFICGCALWACFNSDPSSHLTNTTTTITTGGGMQVGVQRVPVAEEREWLQSQQGMELEPAAVIGSAFPLTLNFTLSGFIDENGKTDNDIVQLTIYYYDKTAGWQILKNIENPRHTVIFDTASAIFGRHTITGPLGYKKDEYIPLVLYFKSRSGKEAFNLEMFMLNRKKRNAPQLVEGATVLAILVTGNHTAY